MSRVRIRGQWTVKALKNTQRRMQFSCIVSKPTKHNTARTGLQKTTPRGGTQMGMDYLLHSIVGNGGTPNQVYMF